MKKKVCKELKRIAKQLPGKHYRKLKRIYARKKVAGVKDYVNQYTQYD